MGFIFRTIARDICTFYKWVNSTQTLWS